MRSASAPALTTISAGTPLTLTVSGAAYLIALSMRLASLADQFAIAAHRRLRRRLDLERQSFLIRQRLVQFADVAGDCRGVELYHVVARMTGFRAGDHQQRVECANE